MVTVDLDIRVEAGLHRVHLGVDTVGIEIDPSRGRSVHRFVLVPGEHAVWIQAERGSGRGLVCGNYMHHATRRVTAAPNGFHRVCAKVDVTGGADIVSLDLADGACTTQ